MNQESQCFICGIRNEKVLETHHLIPGRIGGSDDDENVVKLCRNCHVCVEELYDDDFFKRVEKLVNGTEGKLFDRPSPSRLPRGLRYSSDGEVIPDYHNDFESVVEAIRLRDQDETLRSIEDSTGIPRSTIHDIYKSRNLYMDVLDKVDA